MSDFEEREIAGLTVKIDRHLCVGFEDCVEAAGGVFAMAEDGIATFHLGAGSAGREAVLEACRACPVDALVAIDEQGRQLAP